MRHIGARFPARWVGSCWICGHQWEIDEEIVFVDDELACTRCRDQAYDDNVFEDWK